MRKARMTSYALWQGRDYMMDRGAPTLIVALALGFLTLYPLLSRMSLQIQMMKPSMIARLGGVEAARASVLRDADRMFQMQFIGVVVFLGALIATSGIVSSDRAKGYYRFLFAKPVDQRRYYGQAFAVNLAGFMIVFCLLALGYAHFVANIIDGIHLAVIAAMFLMYSGITFAISASIRGDWMVVLVFTVFTSFVWDKYGASTSLFAKALYVLPPLSRTPEIYTALAQQKPMNWHLLEWFGGYGLACVIIGLVILRFRRMAVL